MILVTSSSSYGIIGLFLKSDNFNSAKTAFAATLSSAVAAATPASSSPDLYSFAFARTSFTLLNS